MKYDSNYKVKDTTKKLRINPRNISCPHGHICCQVQCPCCPETKQVKLKPQLIPKKEK